MIIAFTSISHRVSQSYQTHGGQPPILNERAKKEDLGVSRALKRRGNTGQWTQEVLRVMVTAWFLIKRIYGKGKMEMWTLDTYLDTRIGAVAPGENIEE